MKTKNQNNVAVVQRLFSIVGAADWKNLPEVMDPDFEIHEPPTIAIGGVHKGYAAYEELFRRMATYWTLDVRGASFSETEGRVIAEIDASITTADRSKSAECPIVEILELRDERVIKSRVFYFDTGIVSRKA